MTPGQMLDQILPSVMEAGATISSTYRSRKHNAKVGGVAKSWHTVGLALDVTDFFNPESRELFIWRVRQMGFQVVEESDHVHVEAY